MTCCALSTGKLLVLVFSALFVVMAPIITSCSNQEFGIQCPDGRVVEERSQCDTGNPADDQAVDNQDQTGTGTSQDNGDMTGVDGATGTNVPGDTAGTSDGAIDAQADTVDAGGVEDTESKYVIDPNLNYPDISGWKWEEIVTAMSVYDRQMSGGKSHTVRYNINDYAKYDRGLDSNIDDYFGILRGKYAGGATEYPYNSFRINVVASAAKIYNEWAEKINDTRYKLVYPEKGAMYETINCELIESCRDTVVVYCKTTAPDGELQELWMWSPQTAGESYDEKVFYNMHAMNDKGKSLDTFEKFFCTPV